MLRFYPSGYYYDTETGLYYVSSRYYDPEIGRFVNSDVLVSTGQGLLGFNMFAYCRNNPVCRTDISGLADISASEEAFDDDVEVGPAENELGGGGSGTGPESGTGTATGAAGGTGAPSGGSTGPTYPANPFDFKPKGLEMREHVKPGTGGNGGIIKWYLPGDKRPIFEWDEDYKIGQHYHAMEVEWGGVHNGDHLWPNTPIQEPWKGRYF